MKGLPENYEEIIKERGNSPFSEDEPISEKLKDPRQGEPEYPTWVNEGEKEVKDPLEVSVTTNTEEMEVEVNEQKTSHKAQRVLQLIAAGETPGKAAKQMNTTVRDLMTGVDFRSGLKALIEANHAPNEVRKEMVRAGLNKTFMRNIGGGLKQQKMAIAAAKEIAKDPDVGLNAQPTGTTVTIDLGKLGELLNKPVTLPGLENIENI